MDEPPSYASIAVPSASSRIPDALSHEHSPELQLPSGVFIVKSVHSGLVLQAKRGRQADEYPVRFSYSLQHPFKLTQSGKLELNELSKPIHVSAADNSVINHVNTQLFYLDWDGHLVSASSGKFVDVVDGKLVLASPRPIQAVPTRTNHPLPRFKLDAHTQTLQIVFSCDPLYRGPEAPHGWRDETYALEYVSQRSKPFEPTLWEVASSNIISNLGSRISELGMFVKTPSLASLVPPPVPPKEKERRRASMPINVSAQQQSFVSSRAATNEDEALESDDDFESTSRPVRVVRLPRTWRDEYDSRNKQWSKRRWQVVPVVVRAIQHSSQPVADRNKLPEHMYSFPRSPMNRDLPAASLSARESTHSMTNGNAAAGDDSLDADVLSEEAIAAHIDALSNTSSRTSTPITTS